MSDMKKQKNVSKKELLATLGEEPQLIADDAPFEYIEAFKELRTNLHFVTSEKRNDGSCWKIIITSSVPGEGKSTTAINVALSLSQTGSKVLLIDSDMRNPVLRKYLRLEQKEKAGLSTLLSSDLKIDDCLIQTDYGIDVVANGPIPPNPAELIKSEAMQNLIKTAESQYDYIIFDTPPVGVITDAAALSPLCDGVLYVVRHAYASKKQIDKAINKLQMVEAKLLGAIMTQYDIPKNSGRGYGYRKYKYGYGYGYGYGYSYGYGYGKKQGEE